MKLFVATILAACFVGAALAAPEESGAAASASSAEPATPVAPSTPTAPAPPTAEKPASVPGKPAKKPSIFEILDKIISRAKELINRIKGSLKPAKTEGKSRAATNTAEKKKQLLAKIDEKIAELQARDKALVVPAGPPEERAKILGLKAAIANAIQELEAIRAEFSKHEV